MVGINRAQQHASLVTVKERTRSTMDEESLESETQRCKIVEIPAVVIANNDFPMSDNPYRADGVAKGAAELC
jgi:hypothetical protein